LSQRDLSQGARLVGIRSISENVGRFISDRSAEVRPPEKSADWKWLVVEEPNSAAPDTWNPQGTLRNPKEAHAVKGERVEWNEAGEERESAEERELVEEEAEMMVLESKRVEAVAAKRKHARIMRSTHSASKHSIQAQTCKPRLRWPDRIIDRGSRPDHERHRPHPGTATLVTTAAEDYHRYGQPIEVGADRGSDTMAAMPMSETTADRERLAAFDLQVELVTRVGVQRLADGSGSLREALTSLYRLVHTTREVLRGYGPAAPAVQAPAYALINDVLWPFLSKWHPRLSAHEAGRPAEVSPWEHEQAWAEAPRLRAELAALAEPLSQVAARLSAISGTDLGAG
jgi:hypothetical protein